MNPFAPIRGLFNRFVPKPASGKYGRAAKVRPPLRVETLDDRSMPSTVDIFSVASLPPDAQIVRIAQVEATNEWKVVTNQELGNGREAAYLYTLDPSTHTLSNGVFLAEALDVYAGSFSANGRYLPITTREATTSNVGATARLFDAMTNSFIMEGEVVVRPDAPYYELVFNQASNGGVVAGASNGLAYATFTDLTGSTYVLPLAQLGGITLSSNAEASRLAGLTTIDGVVTPFYADLVGPNTHTIYIPDPSAGLGGAITALPETSLTFAGGDSGGFVPELEGLLDYATVYDLSLGTDFQVTNTSGSIINGAFGKVFDTGLFAGSGPSEGVFVYHYLNSTDHWDHALTFDEYLSSKHGTTWAHNEEELLDVEQSGGTTAWIVREGTQSIIVFITDTVATDTTAPETTITATPLALTSNSTAGFTFGGSDNTTTSNALTYEYRLDGGQWVANTGSLALSGLADGAHSLEVRAKDAAGNVDSTPASFSWTVDSTGPSLAISPPSAAASSGNPVSFTITYSDPHFGVATLNPADITLHRTGSANGTVAVTAIDSASFLVTISNLSGNGPLALSVLEGSAQDTLGNRALAAGPSESVTVAVAPPQPVLVVNAQRSDRILTVDVTGRTSGVIITDYPGNYALTVRVVGAAARPIDVTIHAGAGNDTLLVQADNVRMLGDLGAGNDRLWIDPAALAQASLQLGAGNDIAFGGSLADQIWGDAGNDQLLGGAGEDGLWGGAGNDLLYGGPGSDRYDGGSGVDLFVGFDADDVRVAFDRRDTLTRRANAPRLAALDAVLRNLANRR